MPVHPEYDAFLKMMAAAAPPAGAEIPVADSRANYRAMRPATPELAVGAVRDRTIPGPAGAIPIRIYTPSGRAPFPILVNFHGGGWVIGDLDTVDAVSRETLQPRRLHRRLGRLPARAGASVSRRRSMTRTRRRAGSPTTQPRSAAMQNESPSAARARAAISRRSSVTWRAIATVRRSCFSCSRTP